MLKWDSNAGNARRKIPTNDGVRRDGLSPRSHQRLCWLKGRAEEKLEEQDIVTSTYSYLEILLIRERHEFDYIKLFSNMLDVVPVETEEERQIVLKAVSYFEDGMTAFDAFHAATAETRGHPILSSDKAYGNVDSGRLPLEPDTDEWE